MNNKDLLYKKLNALRLEVDSSIVDDIKSTVDALFQEQNLQQANVSLSLPPNDELRELADEGKDLVLRLLPTDQYGEDERAERLYEILEIIGGNAS